MNQHLTPTVTCRKCGNQPLSDIEYDLQLANPNALWYCPKCHSIAEWNDRMSEFGFEDEEML